MALALRINNAFEFGESALEPATGSIAWLFKNNLFAQKVPDAAGVRNTAPTLGKYYQFDGIDDYISTNLDLSGKNKCTLHAYFYRSSTGERISIGQGESSTARIKLLWNTDNFVYAMIDGNYGKVALGDTGFKKIVMKYDGTQTGDANRMKIFINGVQQTLNFVGTIPESIPTLTNGFYLGRDKAGGATYNYSSGGMYDIRIYDEIKTNSELDNYNLDNILGFFKCDETAGTTAYDSTNNNYDGTMNNINTSTFHVENIEVHKSWINDVGFTQNGSVKIPRNEENTSQDAAGNTLGSPGKIKFDANLVQSHCATFDGTDDYIAVGNQAGAIKAIALWIKADNNTSHTDYLLDLNGTDYISIIDGTLTLNGFASATTTIYVNNAVSSAIPDTANWYHIIINSDTAFTASDLEIGRLSGTGFFDGQIADVRLYTSELDATGRTNVYNGQKITSNLSAHYPLSEGSGTTCHNVVSNANHGTATGVTWTDTQDKFHWNITQGFRLASGVKIPSLQDNSNAADGNALTNETGAYHNNAETKFQFPQIPLLIENDVNNLFYDSSKNPKSVSYSDIVENYNSADKIFANVQTADMKKDFLVYPDALTGSAKTDTLAYVQQQE